MVVNMSFQKLVSSALCLIAVLGIVCADEAMAQVQFPLQISADGRYLEDQNGEPFLINGDTSWSLMVKLSKPEADLYLEDRRSRGFNAIVTELIENEFGGPANRDGELPFLAPNDFGQPNENYFQHADWVITKAAEKGLLVILTPAYLGAECGSQGWCQEMQASTPTELRGFGNYVGNRYRNFHNVIWMQGGDADATSHGADDEVEHIVDGILEVDESKLHTAHCARQSSALDCYDEPWLNVNTTYSDCEQAASRTRTDFERPRLMPFFFLEGRYEGEGASAVCLRAQAYRSVLGGSTGHFFGNSPIWLFGNNWQSALGLVGSRSMTHYSALFRSRRWHLMDPDYDAAVVAGDRGSVGDTDYVAAAVASDGSSIIVYLPALRTISVNLTAISGPQARSWWFDPATGLAQLIGESSTNATVNFTPPGAGDWLLVIDNAALGLPAPGTVGPPAPPTEPPKKSGGGTTSPELLVIMLAMAGLRFRRKSLRRY
jgi:hypothetical protein